MSGILGRFIKGRKRGETGSNHPEGEDTSRQDNALALTHLKRVFADFQQAGGGANIQSPEDKLYTMVPLFNRVSLLLLSSPFHIHLGSCDAASVATQRYRVVSGASICSGLAITYATQGHTM